MKVAFISFAFGDLSIGIASALAEKADVRLFLDQGDIDAYTQPMHPNLELHPFQRPRLRQAVPQLRLGLELVRAIRAYDPDVIHFQHGHFWFNWFLPLLGNYPLVITVHDPLHHVGDKESNKTPQFVMKWGYRMADYLITHADALKAVLLEQGHTSERVEVIAHPTYISPNVDAVEAVPEEANTILFFGRIWEYKGLDYLIAAQPQLNAAFPDAKIIIAGTGEPFDRYEAAMADPSKFEVHYRFIPDDERDRLFQRASIVCLPYVDATISGVIPLAYAFGKPVVATRVGGLPETVDEGQTGYLVPPRDADALAAALIKILADDDQRAAMQRNALKKAHDEWSMTATAQRTLSVYERVVRAPQSVSVTS